MQSTTKLDYLNYWSGKHGEVMFKFNLSKLIFFVLDFCGVFILFHTA